MRNGLRSPWATMRRALRSLEPVSGLPAMAAPVFGSSRSTVPSRVIGSPRGAQVLAAQGAALGRRRGHGAADPARRVAAGVEGAAVLAVVGEVEAGPVAAGHVQGAVGPEGQVADRVARVLLAPVVDEHLLGAGHLVAGGGQARQPARDHAAVAGRPRRVGAGVAPGRRRPADGGVVGVEDVHVRAGREVGVHGHAEHAPVPEVVDVGPEVGEHRRRLVGLVVEDLDDAALLGHEDAAVGGELDVGRVGEPAPDDRLREAGRQDQRPGRRR